ncbi:uncharacterized protein OCT59_020687 [Rhizophagus irregularis]|uniref:Kic1p n=1 Tax=Rhizophagus irregularis (strain DAOM 197198w) TaxID=1432141 RepID=A0A015JJY6_RHIIW|nr:Kic1p [Rhizophagus irregularis DAOM 197198w]UZO02196.1 hypothetical protein OCT59_020687 [Rhizophagus irregularis]GBC26525.1 kinase-like domain-containing protein [Rhizophagus irregularis DAOM 181602=DAOM 197198]
MEQLNCQNESEWINWLDEAINKEHIKYYKYDQFNNVKIIGSGGFGKVFRANWKNTGNILALKEFKYNTAVKEIINEIYLQRKVDFHENIVRFLGITYENDNYSLLKNKKFMIVMEYADGGSLRNYLKLNFSTLTWDNKYQLAYQIVRALECLHNEEILHRDLNSNNIFVHQNRIKLGDFGLSKRIEEISKSGSETIGVIPYIDPNKFEQKNYKFNKKSDIYSLGVILWEISSGKPPFKNTDYNDPHYEICLAIKIMQGFRETVVKNTPIEYIKLYTACWDQKPDERPTAQQVVTKLEKIMSQKNILGDNFEEDNQLSKEIQCNKNTNTSFSNSSIHLTILDKDNNLFQEISNNIISSEKLETDKARGFINKKTLGTKQILRFRTPKLGNKVKKLLSKLKVKQIIKH